MSESSDWDESPASAPASKERVLLNLDTETREDAPEPFGFVINKKRLVLNDPVEIDWQEISAVEDEVEVLELAMSESDFKFFKSQKLPAWKMRKLVHDYQEHYGIDDPSKFD